MAPAMLTEAAGLVGWAMVAVTGALCLTQAAGWAGTRAIAVAQTLTPYLGLLLVPLTLVSLWWHQLVLAAVAVVIAIGVLVLSVPLAFPGGQAEPADGARGLRVAAVNLLYSNPRIDAVAAMLDRLAPDVIAFSEYTAEHRDVLVADRLAARYPYRTDRAGPIGEGVAVWSQLPVDVASDPDTYNSTVDLSVRGPDGDIRIVAVHLPTPLVDVAAWRRDLRTLQEIGRTATRPMLLIGDLNVSYWHPGFRRLLDAGFVDAHIVAGRGFSTSWPVDRPIPRFTRLDHALTTGGFVSTGIVDVAVPGSDHLGLVVTVAPTRRAAP